MATVTDHVRLDCTAPGLAMIKIAEEAKNNPAVVKSAPTILRV